MPADAIRVVIVGIRSVSELKVVDLTNAQVP